jgi:hypothetical protein
MEKGSRVQTIVPPAPPMSLAELAELAEGFACRIDGRELAGPFDDDRRRYTQLMRTARFDAWLIEWAAAGSLALHDHGGASGVLHVVRGALVERYGDAVTNERLRERTISAGYTIHVPATRVHELWNANAAPALSVHVYAPPLSSMTFVDTETRTDVRLVPL